MRIKLIAMGKRMPDWVTTGFTEYSKRLPRDYALELIEIDTYKRTSASDIPRLMEKEAHQMLMHISKGSEVIALEVSGKSLTTKSVSQKLQQWHDDNRDICILVGGPEGLAPTALEAAHWQWSLSELTFPHPLVRVIIAEQLYRAWSLLTGHPYHR